MRTVRNLSAGLFFIALIAAPSPPARANSCVEGAKADLDSHIVTSGTYSACHMNLYYYAQQACEIMCIELCGQPWTGHWGEDCTADNESISGWAWCDCGMPIPPGL